MKNYINIEQYILEFETLVSKMIDRPKVSNTMINIIMEKIKLWQLRDKTNLKENELCDLNHKTLEEIIFFKYYCSHSQIDFTYEEEKFFQKMNTLIHDNPIKLSDEENIIHFIWIGVLSENVSDYLKIWYEVNKDWKINFYYEPEGYLIKTLNKLIKEKSSWNVEIPSNKKADNIIELQDTFFKNYKYEKSIDQNIKEFILQNNWIPEQEIDKIIKEANMMHKKTFENLNNINQIKISESQFTEDIKNFELNQKERYKIYLQELLLRQNFTAASDILRYEILFKYGGYYFDCCDILPRINPEIMPYIEK